MVITESRIPKDAKSPQPVEVPFFRPAIGDQEITEVVNCLASGWLTTGPRVKEFERLFADAVGARYAIALNSCTAALHLAVEALDLKVGQSVLVPTMTFAATAEIVRYLGAVPVLVDCDPVSGNMDLVDAKHKIELVRNKKLLAGLPGADNVVGMIPVHVGGLMIDLDAINELASAHKLWVVEDAAHAFPAAWRRDAGDKWQRCGERSSAVSCFSFYANKTITTGEGGMAVTDEPELAQRIRLMSLHGLSNDAWKRYSGGAWDYRIMAPGFKYNLTDIAAALGIHQLAKAEMMRRRREEIALFFREALSDVSEVELPPNEENRLHTWHLFPIKLRLDRLRIDRNQFIDELKQRGVGASVHWRPLHLHPYYQEKFGWKPEDCRVATTMWQRLVSLPIFSAMTSQEIDHVVQTVRSLCAQHVS